MGGFVYLIGEKDKEGKYKIGSTKANDVNKRLKQLQTGNSSELFLKEAYQTDYPFKLEKMLHNKLKQYSLIGEWFELDNKLVGDFKSLCDYYTSIIECLKDNPYFLKQN